MKQQFTNKSHEKFKKYFSIKNSPGKIEKKLIEKTKQFCKIFYKIPGVLMIGIGNSVAMNYANKNSDIDLFIVCQKDTMWFCRIFITGLLFLFGERKTKKSHREKFCLSFFSTIDGLDFGKFALKKDIYLYFWIIYFKPIVDFNDTYKLFLEKNKSWTNIDKYKYFLEDNKTYIVFSGKKNYPNIFIKYLDKIFKKIFIKKTLNNYKKLKKPYGVIINENILKFHNKDKRKNIAEKLSKL